MKFSRKTRMRTERGKDTSFEVRQVNIPGTRRDVHKIKALDYHSRLGILISSVRAEDMHGLHSKTHVAIFVCHETLV
jgi:hypothetical protein